MIIWLTSYPKSGNTWVRLFLNSLIYLRNEPIDINNIKIQQFPNKKHFKNFVKDVGSISELVKNYTNAQSFLNLDQKIKFLKTHSANWTTEEYSFTDNINTTGTIYIVRDPRNIITSVKNHYQKESYEEALEFMINEKKFIGSKFVKEEFNVPTLISSWSNHYNSWKKLKKNYLLIKYENLLNNPLEEFFKITSFVEKILNINLSEKNVVKAVDNCNFEKLQKQEENKGFVESPDKKLHKFFFLGPNNDWKKILDDRILNKIETHFEKEMKELEYL